MRTQVILTPSESKRLIAKGVAKLPEIEERLKRGTIAVVMGTTNAYVAEELTGRAVDKISFRRGWTIPVKSKPPRGSGGSNDLILRDGKAVEGMSIYEAIGQMEAGDICVKGGNALNYEKKVVGVLIGDPKSGTIGAVLPHVIGKHGLRLVIPIGLEKSIPTDILEICRSLCDGESSPNVPRMMPVTVGKIVTEIEALKVLAGAEATPISAGGVLGAEGSIRLLVSGTKEQLDAVDRLMEEIYGEPPFPGGR
ncbi:MAG: hypothetical protein ACUVXI_15645 [bacterium]